MTTQIKREIAKQDIKFWDGKTSTFSALNATGRPIILDKIDWMGVDVYALYGSRTHTAINTACAAIGTTNLAKLYLSPGTWTIPEDFDISAYSNIYFEIPPGATLQISAGKTLTLYAPNNITNCLYKIFDCLVDPDGVLSDGAVTFSCGGVAYAEWWGIDGSSDETEINAASVALEGATGDGVIQLLAKTYDVDGSIILGDYITLRGMGIDRTIIKKHWNPGVQAAATKYLGATVRQRTTSSGSPNTGIELHDLTIEAYDQSMIGPHLVLYYVNDVVINNIKIGEGGSNGTTGDWSTAFWGNNGRVSNFYIDTVNYHISNDGFHIVSGDGWTVTNGYVHCGDDVIAIANSFNGNISNINISNITGRTEQGDGIKIHNNNTGGSNYLEDINITNTTITAGYTRNGMIYIRDNDSNYRCRRINLKSCVFDTGTTATVNPDGVTIQYAEDINFDNVAIKSAVRRPLYCINSRKINIINSDITQGLTDNYATIELDTVTNFNIYGSRIQGAKATQFNFRLDDVQDARIIGNEIYDILDGYTGINFIKSSTGCDNIIVSNNQFIEASGASTSYALNSAASDSISTLTFIGNDVDELSSDNAGDKIYKGTNRPDTEFTCYGNTGNVYTVSATGQTLKTWGSILLDSSGGGRTATLPDGLHNGQQVMISMQTAGNNFDVTISSHETSDDEVARFDAVDEYLLLLWTGTEWATISNTCTFP